MQLTQHVRQRMSQRGVSRAMVDLVLDHGRVEQNDRYVLDRRDASRRLEAMQQEIRLLKKVVDKGGVVVVAKEDALVTTFNCATALRPQRRRRSAA